MTRYSAIKSKLKLLIVPFIFLLLPTSTIAQMSGSSDEFSKFNFRQSVFTNDLKYVFVFRMENVGNVFVYDVANNVMVKNIEVSKGTILQVIPRDGYFIVLTSEEAILYDLSSFAMLYSFSYNYEIPEEKTDQDKQGSLYNSYAYKMPTWMNVIPGLKADLLFCRWKNGHVKIWNWKQSKKLAEFDIEKDKYGNFRGSISLSASPTRILVSQGNSISVYDSTYTLLSSKTFALPVSYAYIDDYSKRIAVSFLEQTGLNFRLITKILSPDLKNELYEHITNYGNGEKNEIFGGLFKDYIMLIQTPAPATGDNDPIYSLDLNIKTTLLVDIKTGNTVKTFKGEGVQLTSDNKYLLLKRRKGEMPVYDDSEYKKIFGKRYKYIQSNRALEKYKAKVKKQQYGTIVSVDSGDELVQIQSENSLYIYLSVYVVESSPVNGSLRLYDVETGKLIKEI